MMRVVTQVVCIIQSWADTFTVLSALSQGNEAKEERIRGGTVPQSNKHHQRIYIWIYIHSVKAGLGIQKSYSSSSSSSVNWLLQPRLAREYQFRTKYRYLELLSLFVSVAHDTNYWTILTVGKSGTHTKNISLLQLQQARKDGPFSTVREESVETAGRSWEGIEHWLCEILL